MCKNLLFTDPLFVKHLSNSTNEMSSSIFKKKAGKTRLTWSFQSAIQVLESSFVQLREELGQCRNQTGILNEEFKGLTRALMDKEHLMPRTLKGTCVFPKTAHSVEVREKYNSNNQMNILITFVWIIFKPNIPNHNANMQYPIAVYLCIYQVLGSKSR